ncbi:sirohydrochlorin chelatase [Comamonas composti]|uniref:sirohydrochlorin chelatase n=1 Tax=Comamonas composti TaxID=408558 RepID=UPI00040AB0F3|nr:CbiX/SirB N-terminal domain-containing protein [Comamonas composti]
MTLNQDLDPAQAGSGLILLAHGSPDALWRVPIEAVLQAVQQQAPHLACCCAYLDACEPELPTAAAELVAAGASRIVVLPLFLGTGKHARQDIPRLVELVRMQHPQLDLVLEPAAGENPLVTGLLARIALQSLEKKED